MDRFLITGGAKLTGSVAVSGSKNATLPIMAACLLARGRSVIHNVPDLRDVRTMIRVLESLGARGEQRPGTLVVDTTGATGDEAPYELVKTMRAAYYVLGPLVAVRQRARVSLPGGCAIGARPVDLHLKGLRALGAEVEVLHGYIEARAGQLRGGTVTLEGPHGSSVGATINTMMAATLAEGETIIDCAALEPEVVDVAAFLRAMGGQVEGAGTSRITIRGVGELAPAEHTVIPDRIEAGTLAIAVAMTHGSVELAGCRPDHCRAVLELLEAAGVGIEEGHGTVRIEGGRITRHPFRATVAPYPGFPTDMQAQAVAMACLIPGISVVTETIFESRFLHVVELLRMGADIAIAGNSVIVTGVPRLTGAPVMASDLRASAALVLAGLVAEGETEVSRIYHLDRGYEALEIKLRPLGADVRRVPGPPRSP